MQHVIQVTGFLGGDDRTRAAEGPVRVTLSGSGQGETLSVEYVGKYRVALPLRPIQGLAARARQQVRAGSRAVELTDRVTGYGGRHPSLYPGPTEIWFSSINGFEMLSLEYAGMGQISLPFAPVASLIRANHSSLA